MKRNIAAKNNGDLRVSCNIYRERPLNKKLGLKQSAHEITGYGECLTTNT